MPFYRHRKAIPEQLVDHRGLLTLASAGCLGKNGGGRAPVATLDVVTITLCTNFASRTRGVGWPPFEGLS